MTINKIIDTVQAKGYIERSVVCHSNDDKMHGVDFIAKETPVALVYNGISHAVMMATPCDLKEFAVGFTLTEGIVDSLADIYDVDIDIYASSVEVNLTISQQSFFQFKAHRRTMLGRTGCGVCGIESIELLDLNPQPINKPLETLSVSTAIIELASKKLLQHQFLMSKTGGAHAAAWCNKNGEVLKVFEDVGRHNALDKLIGYLLLNKSDLSNGFVFISSRGSYELVRKVARMNITLLATISAPTSLAIEIAKKAKVALICFCRNNRFIEY